MRALLDANILASFLLARARPDSTIARIVTAALAYRYVLLLPVEVLEELRRTIATAPYLVARVRPEDAQRFIATLQAAAVELPPLPDPPAPISRDPADDYLFAQARAGRADYLVSGDKDVRALAGAGLPFAIVTPAEFLAVLEAAGPA